MYFPDSFIDELKQRLPISKIIGKKVRLKRTGLVYTGLCPFHHEKTPSFTVQDHKGIYHCFGCHAGGDVINFVSETEKLSFSDAVEQLANLAGMQLPKQSPVEQAKLEHRHNLVDVVSKAALWFQTQLKLSTNISALEYFQNRGIEAKDIQNFSLGYAPAKGLLVSLQKEGISLNMMVDAGLAIKTDNGDYIDRFRNRVMFPIKNQKKQIVGFGGRALSAELMPKYLNSPETPIFKKNNLLYAADMAYKQSLQKERVIVVEGYMDAIFMHKAGLIETVAALGTAFNQTHLQLLWNMANEIVLCFDGDTAGKKAMLKAAHTALAVIKPGLTLRFCFLPKGQDPDDVIKQYGVTYINKLLENSVNLADFLWQSELQQIKSNNPESKALFEQKILDIVKQINDPIIRNHYQQFMKQGLWREFNQFKGNKNNTKFKQIKVNPLPLLREVSIITRLEYSLFAQLIAYPDLINDRLIFEDISHIEIEHNELELLRSILIEYHENQAKSLNDLLIENNLVKLAEFLCGSESSFINKISEIDLNKAKEIWIITYKKYLLELLKTEYNQYMQKVDGENNAFIQAIELRNTIDKLIKEINEQENNLYQDAEDS